MRGTNLVLIFRRRDVEVLLDVVDVVEGGHGGDAVVTRDAPCVHVILIKSSKVSSQTFNSWSRKCKSSLLFVTPLPSLINLFMNFYLGLFLVFTSIQIIFKRN